MKKISKFIAPILIGSGLIFSGCATISSNSSSSRSKTEEALVIPDFPTAKEQYAFANVYKGMQLVNPELSKRRVQMDKISQCFQKVITNFPNDAEFVAMSILELGDAAVQAERLDSAEQYYRQAIASFPNDKYVQARAIYTLGRVQDLRKDFSGAKPYYKQVMDTFSKEESRRIQEIVQRASVMYYQVHDKNKQG